MSIFHFCRPYFALHRLLFLTYILIGLSSLGIAFLSPLMLGNFIDLLVEGGEISSLVRFSLLFSVLNLVGLLLSYLHSSIYVRLQMSVAYRLSQKVVSHLQQVSLSFINQQDKAYLSQRINGDGNELVIFYISSLQGLLSNTLLVVIPIMLLLQLHATMAIIFVASIACYGIIYIFLKKPMHQTAYKLKESQNTFFSRFHKQFQDMSLIKLKSLGADYISEVDASFLEVKKRAIKNNNLGYVVTGLDNTIKTLAHVLLFVLGGWQILNGNFSIGMFTIFSAYFSMILNGIRYFFNFGMSYQQATVALERLSALLAVEVEPNGETTLGAIRQIHIENVALPNMLDTFCAVFKKGKLYLITGENGSGKTTLLHLLMGMYINERTGVVLFNDQPTEILDMIQLRREQIAFVEQMPQQTAEYQAEKRKSGGEMQLTVIKAELAKSASVVILDEPTSALDTANSEELLALLANLKKECIVIVVSHDERLRTIADEVVRL